jgi:hypothetical protein
MDTTALRHWITLCEMVEPQLPDQAIWTSLGLDPASHDAWLQASSQQRATVRAERSVTRTDGWIVLYRVDRTRDMVLGKNLKNGQAHDAADFLAGRSSII